jgi:hypothetical protein
MTERITRTNQITDQQGDSMRSSLRSVHEYGLNLRPEWRGFSFSGYWFSYYFAFTGERPLCAGGKMRPG